MTAFKTESFCCPRCHSEEIQSFPMVYENGTTTSHGYSRGIGTGLAGGKIGVGFGTSAIHTTNLTLAAQKAAPPVEKRIKILVPILIFLFIGPLFGGFVVGPFVPRAIFNFRLIQFFIINGPFVIYFVKFFYPHHECPVISSTVTIGYDSMVLNSALQFL